MGYRRKSRKFQLVFTDPEMAGLEVTMKSLSIGRFLDLTVLADSFADPDKATLDDAEALFRVLADHIVSWNLEDEDGTPVPADIGGIRDQELDLILQVVGAWLGGMSAVDPTSRTNSGSSEIPPEVSLELESLSQSLDAFARQR